MERNIDRWTLPREYSELMEHKKWTHEIPYLSFPLDWEVKIVPPFSGAVVRFYIKKEKAFVSVYLDCYDLLGYCQEPYWEVHPYTDDVFRCEMNETDKLLTAITRSILSQLNPN